MKRTVLILLLAGAPLAAFAQAPAAPPAAGPKPEDIGISKDFKPCMERAQAQPQEKMGDALFSCLEAERKKQDARVTKAYQTALSRLPAEGKKRLTLAQQNWAKFRDSNCNFYADEKGAPPVNLNNSDCRLGVNVSRAAELENVLQLIAAEEKAAAAQGAAPTSAAPAAPGPGPRLGAPAPGMGAGGGLTLPPAK